MSLVATGSDPSNWTGTYIEFVPIGILAGKKTMRWYVSSKNGGVIGLVKWFGRWRKYSFFPMPDTVFEGTCMREISEFIEDRTREHRSGI